MGDNAVRLNVPFVPSINFRKGRTQPCTLLVLHYTAGGDFDATVDYLVKPNPASASAHLVVARSPEEAKKHPGGVVQLVDFDDVGDVTASIADPDEARRENQAQEQEAGGGDLPVAFAEDEIGIALIPFPTRFEVGVALHASASP